MGTVLTTCSSVHCGPIPTVPSSGASYVVFGQRSAALPSLTIGDLTAVEGNTGASQWMFPITLSSPSTQTVTVQFSTVDGTASAVSDYLALINQTLEFAPGETTKLIAVTVNGDTVLEPDETFFVDLLSATNATLVDPQGLGKILNDEMPSVSINDVRVIEGASGTTTATFTVSLSGASSQPVTVQYATADGSATAAEDYIAVPLATLTFDPGEQSKTVTVTIHSDTATEPEESFFVNLSNPTNATLADAQSVGLILNRDSVFELSSLDGFNGFKIGGETVGDFSGHSVSDAGDVNGDGFDDLLIGAYGAAPNGSDSGVSYVVFGKSDGFSTTLQLSTLNGSDGFKISGVAAGDNSGFSVSTAGDVNGDGFDDLLIGAFGAAPHGPATGASYVVLGRDGPFSPTLELSTLNGSDGFRISGASAYDLSGFSVSTAGDVNGDGFDDLIIGARSAGSSSSPSGASYVVFGEGGAFPPTIELSRLNGSDGFKINGVAADDNSGISVSTAGDVNGDGFDDLIIGAYQADPNGDGSGASYVIFGKGDPFSPALELSALNGTNGFTINGVAAGDSSGLSVSTAGDVNGDGFDDLIIGAYRPIPTATVAAPATSSLGRAMRFPRRSSFPRSMAADGFKINGASG